MFRLLVPWYIIESLLCRATGCGELDAMEYVYLLQCPDTGFLVIYEIVDYFATIANALI